MCYSAFGVVCLVYSVYSVFFCVGSQNNEETFLVILGPLC